MQGSIEMRYKKWIYGLPVYLALLASGCTPYAYKKEIESFSKSTQAFSAGIDEISTSIVTNQRENTFWEAYAAPSLETILSDEHCKPTNSSRDKRCVLSVGDKAKHLKPIESSTIQAIGQLKAFSRYADALSAVANAEDSASFDAASGRLAASASAFANTISGGGGAVVAPVIQAGLAIKRISLESARLKQLRTSVAKVDAQMPSVERRISAALSSLKKARILAIDLRMDLIEDVLMEAQGNSERALLIRELQKGADEIAALQSHDPAKLVKSMVGAHGALAKALETPRTNLADVAKELSAFSEIANAFKAAVSAD